MPWSSTVVLCQTKNLIAFSATLKDFVLVLKLNLLNINHLLVWLKRFGNGTICKSILFWHKRFGQTILGPVNGQGITLPVPVVLWFLTLNLFFQIKNQIKVLGGRGHGGWGISADCHAVFPCSFELFRRLVAPEAMEITPSAYNNLTPVILAQLSEEGATKLFGVTKTKGGTRMGSWYISKMDITHVPSKNELRVWWIMPQSSERSH